METRITHASCAQRMENALPPAGARVLWYVGRLTRRCTNVCRRLTTPAAAGRLAPISRTIGRTINKDTRPPDNSSRQQRNYGDAAGAEGHFRQGAPTLLLVLPPPSTRRLDMLSGILTTSFLFGAALAAQSSPTVVCVAGQCLEGYTNTTSAYISAIDEGVRTHFSQLARLSPRLAPQPACSYFPGNTAQRPTLLSFMTSLRLQARPCPALRDSTQTRLCPSTSPSNLE